MSVKFSNNGHSTLASSLTSSGTSITVASGHGSRFPSLSSGEHFYATLIDSSNNLEIVKVTARSSDVLTATRAQESTTARAFAIGDRIELRVTAQGLTDLTTVNLDGDKGDITVSSSGSVWTIDNNVITAAKIDVSGNGTSGQALLSDGDGTFTFGDVTIPTTNSAGWHTSTRYTFSNTSFAEINSNLSCTITPRSTSSKILLLWACMCGGNSSGYQNHIAIARNTTVLTDTATNCYRMDYNNNVAVNHPTIMYIDSPNTTSAVTYRTYGKTSGNTLYFNKGQNNDNDWGKSHGIAVEIEI